MARKRMVTRTVEQTSAKVMTLDVTTVLAIVSKEVEREWNELKLCIECQVDDNLVACARARWCEAKNIYDLLADEMQK